MITVKSYCKIDGRAISANGETVSERPDGQSLKDWFTNVHKESGLSYPKFYKMDNLSKAGFLAAEQVLPENEDVQPKEDTAVVLFSGAGSLDTDLQHMETIADNNNYYPSPHVFVYTLANIVCGEIAIRHRIFGETMCYIAESLSAEQLYSQLLYLERERNTRHAICGWCDILKDECKVLLLHVEICPACSTAENEEEMSYFRKQLTEILYSKQ